MLYLCQTCYSGELPCNVVVFFFFRSFNIFYSHTFRINQAKNNRRWFKSVYIKTTVPCTALELVSKTTYRVWHVVEHYMYIHVSDLWMLRCFYHGFPKPTEVPIYRTISQPQTSVLCCHININKTVQTVNNIYTLYWHHPFTYLVQFLSILFSPKIIFKLQ